MTQKIDYSTDFLSFYRDLYVVEGSYGPHPIIPPFLAAWLQTAFPAPTGSPAARNIGDFRTKKEGKTSLAGGVALYAGSRKPYQEVVIVSSDLDQSRDRTLRSIKYAIEQGPLSAHAKVYRDYITLDNSSLITAMPMNWQGAAGGNYSAVIFDELHAWVYESNRRLFDEMVIPPTQPEGVRWFCSYAGFEGESLLLREWWDKALQGQRLPGELPIYHNKQANLLAFVDTGPESWRMPWMSPAYIEETRTTERPNTFRRIWLNEWVSNESQFLPEGAWERCYSREVKPLAAHDKRRVVLGADASTTRDLTALVGVEYNPATNTGDVVYCRVWKPQRGILRAGKPTIDLEDTIGEEVKRLYQAKQLDCVVCDPYQLHSLIIEWEKLGIRVIELAQNAGRVEADQGLYDAVIGQTIRHYNDHTLNEHIKNAVAIESPRGYRLAKEKTSQKIDAAVALSMAFWGSLSEQKARGGAVQILPDPWECEDLYRDYDTLPTAAGGYIWIRKEGSETHPPGISWRNCRNRNRGCRACVLELQEEGFYDAEYQAGRDITPMSIDEYQANRARLYTPLPPTGEEREAEATYRIFKKAVQLRRSKRQ